MKTTETKKPAKRTGFAGIFNGNDAEETVTEIVAATEPKKNDNCIRMTFLLDADLHEKIKIMAHWELTTLKDVLNSAVEKTVAVYEKEHGALISVPKSQKK